MLFTKKRSLKRLSKLAAKIMAFSPRHDFSKYAIAQTQPIRCSYRGYEVIYAISQAINAPRIHYQGLPNIVLTEPYSLKSSTVQNLWSRGYRVAPFLTWGAAESILVSKTKLLYGANDSRKSAGKAVAY